MSKMEIWEFILLILGIFSLIHYISYSLYRYRNYYKFVSGLYEESSSIEIIRIIELGIIIVNAGVWLYKILF